MRKNLIGGVVQRSKFMPGIYRVDGTQFGVGLVQDMPLYMSMAISNVVFDNGWVGPVIVFNIEDVKMSIETRGKYYTGKFLSFVTAHEVYHIKQFKGVCSDELRMADQLRMEVEADCYAIKHTGTSVLNYKEFVDQIEKSSRGVYAAIQGPALFRILSFFDNIMLDKRKRDVERSIQGNMVVPLNMVYSKIVTDIFANI